MVTKASLQRATGFLGEQVVKGKMFLFYTFFYPRILCCYTFKTITLNHLEIVQKY